MLTHLHAENFKVWKTLDVKLGRVTGLFGTNSSGKSSLLQFLLMLKQTKNATDRGVVLDFGGPEQLVNLGGFKDVVHAHDDKASIVWELDWSLRKATSISDTTKKRTDVLAEDSSLSISSVVHTQTKGSLLVSDYLAYGFGGYSFYTQPKKSGSTEFDLIAEIPEGAEEFRFVRNKQRAWALPGPIKTHLFPDQAKTYFQNAEFLGVLESEYEAMMDSIYYLGPLRDYPKREYAWTGTSPFDVGQKGQQTIAAILAATARGDTRNHGGRTHYKPFQRMIAFWLKELGLIHEFEIEEIAPGANLYQAKVRRDSKSAQALLTDVGFGVSQVLPALVLLYYVPEGSTVIMEQPEIHLHPSVQSGLADVILTVAQARDLQVIVESHSEHLLRRFQRRVADRTFPSEDLKLYFCDSKGGEAKLLDLDIDLYGEIRNWPPGFFGDEMTEIAETRKAILKNKMKQSKA